MLFWLLHHIIKCKRSLIMPVLVFPNIWKFPVNLPEGYTKLWSRYYNFSVLRVKIKFLTKFPLKLNKWQCDLYRRLSLFFYFYFHDHNTMIMIFQINSNNSFLIGNRINSFFLHSYRNFRLCTKKIIFVPNIFRIFGTYLKIIWGKFFFLATNIRHLFGANLKKFCLKSLNCYQICAKKKPNTCRKRIKICR